MQIKTTFPIMSPSLIIKKNAATRPVQNAIAKVDGLKKLKDELKAHGQPNPFIDHTIYDGTNLIKKELFSDAREEIQRLENEIGLLKDDYEKQYAKDIEKHKFDIQNYQNKVMGMTSVEIEKEAEEYIVNKEDARDPHLLDLLAAQCRILQIDIHNQLRDEMRTRQYESPWLVQGEGKALLEEEKAWSRISPGDLVLRVDGSLCVMNINDLLEDEPSDEAEEGEE